jgi:hypothetical protein
MAKPYQLVFLHAQTKEWVLVKESDSPTICREAESRIARNPKVVQRIELRDAFGTECLETLWDSSW